MRSKNWIKSTLTLLLLLIASLVAQPVPSYGQTGTGKQQEVFMKREKTEILVKYKDSAKNKNSKDSVKNKLKLSKLETKVERKASKVDLLEIDEKDNIDTVIQELRKDPNVEYVQPNYKLNIMAAPSDPRFTEQWSLLNNGQEIEGQKGRANVDINALPAWDLTKGTATTVIGVLDTGIDINHEELKNNIFVNTKEIPNNGIDDDLNGYIDDVNGWDFANGDKTVYDSSETDLHGTYTAGIIAASANNAKGISGVAPNVKILPLKFINGDTGYTCDAIGAIEYAMSMGVKIINCSFGGTDNNYALKDAMKNSGILFIAAGGNRGGDVATLPVYPACFDIPNVLSVAAIDSYGVLASFSSYGNKIHVAAPGINVLSTTPGNDYDYFSGTSVSAPIVTGIAALVDSYLPNKSYLEIADRIKNNVTACTNLQGKVTTAGRVNAFAALTNTPPSPDNYTGPGGETPTIPGGEQGGEEDTWYTLDQLAKIKEKLHYGESGVNPASGNFSFTCNDMSIAAPGFQINISRTYNSREDRMGPMGRGWTFGFEGAVYGTDVVAVSLPNGGVQRFRRNGTTYTPEDSRSIFVKNADNTYTLTTKDQYSYGFNTNGWLTWMKDRNGNVVTIQVDAQGKVQEIIDTVGRHYPVAYNAKGLIETIKDTENRVIRYEYDANNYLVKVTDPMGGVMRYSYDSLGYLNKIEDHNQKTVEVITYNHAVGENQHKVSQAMDAMGDSRNFSYDMLNRKTTITDVNGRVYTYWFDTAMYTIKVQDPEGKYSTTEYFLYGGTNKYGDIKTMTDRNNNKTEYTRDDRGNVTKIINPDLSTKEYAYDDKNNLVMEKDEMGKPTFYLYDAEKRNLLKKAQPLNGVDVYAAGGDESKFAVTTYQYYTAEEAKTNFGCNAASLLKSITDPMNNTTEYTYDAYGSTRTVKNPEGKVTTHTYNTVGWETQTLTPKGYATTYTYDKNGLLEKSVQQNGETTRMVYDVLGQKVKQISPNQYEAGLDDLTNHTYTGDQGTRYVYYDNGKVKSVTDAEGYTTTYTYTIYGNVETETKPNGSSYRYEYDVMDRMEKVYFKEDANAVEALLQQYSYAVLSDGKTQKTETVYLNDTEKAVTVSIFDYAGRPVEKQNPDGTKTRVEYNANGTLGSSTAANSSTTYYKYDGLNRLVEQWVPLEIENGELRYAYTQTDYDKAGRKTVVRTGKDKVALYGIPASLVVTNYEYYKDGKVKSVYDDEGRKTEYGYDDDGNLLREAVYTDAATTNITEYVYNHLGKVAEKKVYATAGDFAGYGVDDKSQITLSTVYTYDKNGNLTTVTTPAGVVTTYAYDNLNRQIGVKQPGMEEYGNQAEISSSTTLNWEGKPVTVVNENGNTTAYEYSKRGFLVKVTDANNGVTAFEYDRAGRKILEVSPQNYDAAKPLTELNRSEYLYDVMGRVKSKIEKYLNPSTQQWETVNAKSYKYDSDGNVVKELDALGFDAGTGSTPEEKINTGYGTEYTYNLVGKVLTALDPVSKERGLDYSQKFSYDGLGRKVSETNANGVITLYSYDNAGNVLAVKVKKNENPEEQTLKTATYDLAGRQKTQTDGNGNTTSYEYNSLNKVKKAVTPGDGTIPSNTIVYQYDLEGNLKFKQDAVGRVNLYDYDNKGRVLAQTQQKADGTEAITLTFRYDRAGNKRFETDGNGNTTEYIYDALNRVTQTKKTVGGTVRTATLGYDRNGNQTTQTDWYGNTAENKYDPLNRLIEKRDPYTIVQKLEYNRNNAQVKSYDALNNLTQYLYDKNNRLVTTIDPEGHSTSQSYDNVGNIQTKTDGRNITTTYTYDEQNRLQSVTNAKSEITRYTYDNNGNTLTQTDGNGNTTNFEYNAANKIARKIDAEGRTGQPGSYTYIAAKTESYTYYADGSLKTQIDRNGETITYSYDIHGRLVSKSAGAESIAYTYDKNGNLLTTVDSTGTTTRTYDEMNRVTSKDVPNFGTTTFGYDILTTGGVWGVSSGQLTAGFVAEGTKDPKGNITTKVYDKAGRLKYVNADGQTTTYEYYDNGSRKSVVYPGGAREDYTYDKDGLNKTLVNRKADGTVIDAYSYTYDGAHNQTEKTDGKGATLYTYDSLNRLETVKEPNGKLTSYTFDKAGNRLTETVTLGGNTTSTTYAYNEQNRLVSTITSTGNGVTEKVTYQYDNNGNMVSQSKTTAEPQTQGVQGSFNVSKAGSFAGSTVTFFAYDKWNQLVGTTTGDQTLGYKYNAEGLRVEKVSSGNTVRYLYEYDKVVLEMDSSGNQVAKNIYGTNLLARTVDGDKYYYMYNGHGDVTALLDTTNQVDATYYYDAFGNIVETTGDVNNPIRYAGYQYDAETGHYYLNARYYDPKIARFLQEDTYRGSANDPLSLNLYAYCFNNPIRYFDPTGHIVTEWDKEYGIAGEIDKYTKQWEAANAINDQTGMAEAARLAKDLRDQVQKNVEESIGNVFISDDSGYTYTVSKTGTSLYYKDSNRINNQGSGGSELPPSKTGYSTMPRGNEGTGKGGTVSGLSSGQTAKVVFNDWINTSPENRFKDIPYGMRAANDFQMELTKLKSQGYDITRLTTEQLDELYKNVYDKQAFISAFMFMLADMKVSSGSGNTNASKGADKTGAYNPNLSMDIGNGLGKLNGKSINVSEKGLSLVKNHISQFGDIPENQAMINRIESALKNGQPITGADASFYMHEAAEATMMQKGISYEVAHEAILQKYNVSPYSVYHPEVIQQFSEWFNQGFKNFWGLK